MPDYITLADRLRAAFDRDDIDWDDLLAAERALRAFASRIKAAPADDVDGYIDAFYEIAKLLDIGAQNASPKAVFEREMLPKLRAALSVAPIAQDREDAQRDVIAERERQKGLGWTPQHDDEHDNGEIAKAASCYALGRKTGWWPSAWEFKDKGERPNLVRAGALILAEIERIDRAARKAPKEQT